MSTLLLFRVRVIIGIINAGLDMRIDIIVVVLLFLIDLINLDFQ